MLGTIDRDHVSKLIRLLAADDAAEVIKTIAAIDEQFPDYARLLEDLSRVLQQIAVQQVVGSIESEDEVADAELAQLAGELTAEDVQLFYQIAVLGRRDLHLAPDPRSGAEMTLLRMLAFRPATARRGEAPNLEQARRRQKPRQRRRRAAPKVVRAHTLEPSHPAVSKWQEPDWAALMSELALPGAVRLLARQLRLFAARSEHHIPEHRPAVAVAVNAPAQGSTGKGLVGSFWRATESVDIVDW